MLDASIRFNVNGPITGAFLQGESFFVDQGGTLQVTETSFPSARRSTGQIFPTTGVLYVNGQTSQFSGTGPDTGFLTLPDACRFPATATLAIGLFLDAAGGMSPIDAPTFVGAIDTAFTTVPEPATVFVIPTGFLIFIRVRRLSWRRS